LTLKKYRKFALKIHESWLSCKKLSFTQSRENITLYYCTQCTEAEFLDEIQTKVGVFLLAIQSRLYSFALRFLFLQSLTVSKVHLLYTVNDKGGNPDRKPYTLPYDLRNPYTNLKSETLKIMPRNLNEVVRS
jgi:hypothetical protein